MSTATLDSAIDLLTTELSGKAPAPTMPRQTIAIPVKRRLPNVRRAVVQRPVRSLAVARLAQHETIVAAEGSPSPVYHLTKRALDIAGALAILILASPVLLATLIILTITTKGHPLFSQERVGHLGRRFRMWKFRTMRLDAERLRHLVQNEQHGPVFKNRRDPRITRVGRWLRKTSIDELPQLFNVLAGQMSLVGPRPALVSEVANYAAWQRRRLAVLPGLTCLWQVSGRSRIGFLEWVRMDLWYVRHQSLWVDLKLLLLTPLTVLTCRGAY